MNNVNIICTHLGAKYGDEYVKILYNMVKRNMTIPFKFYCLSDREEYLDADDKKIEDIHILKRPEPPKGEVPLSGWWAKLYYFHPDLKIKVDYNASNYNQPKDKMNVKRNPDGTPNTILVNPRNVPRGGVENHEIFHILESKSVLSVKQI